MAHAHGFYSASLIIVDSVWLVKGYSIVKIQDYHRHSGKLAVPLARGCPFPAFMVYLIHRSKNTVAQTKSIRTD